MEKSTTPSGNEQCQDQDTAAQPRILYVIGSLIRGGAETHLGQICPRLRQRGFRPEIFLLTGGGALIGDVRRAGIPVHEPLYKNPPKAGLPRRVFRLAVVTLQLWVFLLHRRFDVVHFFLPASYVVGAPVALLSGHWRLVMSRRSMNFYQSEFPMIARIERVLHRCGIAVLGNSKRVVSQLREEEGVPEDRLGLIYNGIDLASFASAPSRMSVRDKLGIPDGALVMSIVANLIPYKGHADLFEALHLVKDDLPVGWRLLIVGRDDGIGSRLKVSAAQMGLAENIVTLGVRDDVASLLTASDIGLLPSHEEGFSNALVEGMAAGLPMIATDVGGNGEAVLDGVTGLIVPPKNPPALAAAIMRLAMDATERASMGSAARRRAQEFFSMDRCVDAYERFYRAFMRGAKMGEIPGVRACDFGAGAETRTPQPTNGGTAT